MARLAGHFFYTLSIFSFRSQANAFRGPSFSLLVANEVLQTSFPAGPSAQVAALRPLGRRLPLHSKGFLNSEQLLLAKNTKIQTLHFLSHHQICSKTAEKTLLLLHRFAASSQRLDLASFGQCLACGAA